MASNQDIEQRKGTRKDLKAKSTSHQGSNNKVNGGGKVRERGGCDNKLEL